jgi:hypothetical protein
VILNLLICGPYGFASSTQKGVIKVLCPCNHSLGATELTLFCLGNNWRQLYEWPFVLENDDFLTTDGEFDQFQDALS